MVSLRRKQLDSKAGIGSCGRVAARWQWKTKAVKLVGRCKSSQARTGNPGGTE